MAPPEQAPDGASIDAMAAPPPKKIDPIYYNWSSTFNIMLGRMTGNRDVKLEKVYFEEMDVIKADSICKRCEDNKGYLLQYSPIVRFLKDEVAKLGGDLNEKNILCRVCTNEQSGGFSLDHGILLCANKFRNRGHQEDTMAHEMVHAWDHLKWKVEADNLRHQACLEVYYSLRSVYASPKISLIILYRSVHRHFLANVALPANFSQETNGVSQSSFRTAYGDVLHCP